MLHRFLKYCLLVILMAVGVTAGSHAQSKVRVGLAWQPSAVAYDRVVRSVELAGGEAVILPQIRPQGFEYEGEILAKKYLDADGVLLQQYADQVKRNTYHGAGLDTLLRGIDAVVFLGGQDISSTLFATPQPWHGIAGDHCNATRDVSEYLTMSYCLDNDIPVLGLCRGMQMLGVVSGAPLIQDIGSYFLKMGKMYSNIHRSLRDEEGNRHYTPHNVKVIDKSSLLYSIALDELIENVPSWHHQILGDVAGTPLKVTGVTYTDGIDVIEAIERTDKAFALGVQFHPEEAVRQHLDNVPGASRFMRLCEGVSYFRALINHCKKQTTNE